MKKVLFAATVMIHIQSFHISYLKWFKDRGFEVHVACNMSMSKGDGEEIPIVTLFMIYHLQEVRWLPKISKRTAA